MRILSINGHVLTVTGELGPWADPWEPEAANHDPGDEDRR